ncbi:MAG: hypothetical protein V3U29_01850 [Phycisphaeraceae bacterium]
MNFSTDRDLLALEPNVFRDVPLLSQQRVSVTDAVVSGTTLTSATADFQAAGVDAGSVVLVSEVAHEVVARTDANTLTISLPRTSLIEASIPSGDGTNLAVVARTFAPQATLVHDVLLRLVGIDPNDPDSEITEDSIVSLGVLSRLEALGTLERVYSAALALAGDNSPLHEKTREYRRRFQAACASASVLIDLNGDGQADARRTLGVIRLRRS